MDLQTELVIVGGGLAGFCAALEAARAGHEVILLEKQAETGGSSAMSGGCLAFAGTDLQRANGIEDSSELLFNDLREVGQFENDEALVRVYADKQLDTYEWLKQAGVQFGGHIEASSGQSVPRVHNVDPADTVRIIAARARETGKVRVLASTAAQRLIRNAASGRVEGVTVLQDGEAFSVRGRLGVLLASGGFCRNAELVHRYAPQYDAAVFIGGEGNVGDGLKMAWQIGADNRDMIYIKGTYGKHPTDETNHHSCLAVYKGAIAVNQDGRRFVDESISYKLLGDACIRQPYGATYQILDRKILESGDNLTRILDLERRLEEGLMIEADTLEQLAALIEVPAQALLDTVNAYNGYVSAGSDPEFGRQHLVHQYGDLVRIEQGPFYAYPSTAAVFGTYCGLCIDPGMRVLDVYGDALEGLYAAGEIVGGLHGAAYMTGTALGKAAIFGRVAARTAMAAASREAA
ncbi:FAD-dependent oxidoreductase [Pollutimonas bauzanensis]|uniref:Fumarate reductase flavoprotein subunit n=1 Tax=Pollutimonas bauzanensis TaxID=658167 RepID=A0A1M5QVI3_9BURK|nr:flavocytochrome c [Pollutimonas bauzanensis]SHH18112.1 fumarate reductase flavoprotein subunit [Pollutimonas bauzanensis]